MKAYSDPASTFMIKLLRISVRLETPLKANSPTVIHPLGIFPYLSRPSSSQDKLQFEVGPSNQLTFHFVLSDLIKHQKSSNFIDYDFIAHRR